MKMAGTQRQFVLVQFADLQRHGGLVRAQARRAGLRALTKSLELAAPGPA